jgi:hypothetical protein
MPPFKLPNDNDVLSLKDIIKHGPTIITSDLIGVLNPYHNMAQLVFEADNFPEVSKGILREYMALAANGQQIKFAELVESLMDIEMYEQPKQNKVRMGRGGASCRLRVITFVMVTQILQFCMVHCMIQTLQLETRSQERVNVFVWTMVSRSHCSLNSAMSSKNLSGAKMSSQTESCTFQATCPRLFAAT